ncbi:MAG: DEAD/DEAH box helicase [Candidatus Omnitrophota bacterium]
MAKKKKTKRKCNPKNISHITKPKDVSLEEWQIILRGQIAREQKFRMKNNGGHPVFSTFTVSNPNTDKRYRVVIRGEELGINYCSCPDFSVNTLGTCKHIEYVLNRLKRKKGGKELIKQGFVPEYSSVTLRYGLKRRVVFIMGEKAGARLKGLVKDFFDSHGFLTQWGFEHFDNFIQKAETFRDNVRYHEDALQFIARVRDVKKRYERIKNAFPKGVESDEFENLLKLNLFPYQKDGALFAARAGRSLIADDMGLGKTMQAIAASEIMARHLGIEKVLIICPTSLKHQWLKEIQRFTDNRIVHVIEGMVNVRKERYKEESFFKITNYDVIHRDMEAINSWSPDIIILDEAQRIKNWRTRVARSVKGLSSPYALVLTGTPLENRLEELHSIVSFLDWHHLGPLFRFLHTHQVTDNTGKVVGYKKLNELGDSLSSILIRRRKHEVLLQLPERIDKTYFVKMTPEQMTIHDENKEMVARLVAKWKRYHFLSEVDRQRLLVALQIMRMACDSTYLVDKKTEFGNKINELEIQLREIFENSQTKVVIFSQWLRMMELVKTRLDLNNWQYVFLHGGVPGKNRGKLIQQFRDDPEFRIFLSTEAGGVGLNLQNADVVVNLDLPWNPAVLEQRIGRVHRLGQSQSVRVINFVAEESIEQGMLSLLQFKRSMFSGVLDNGENEVFMGGTRFNHFMKTVETASEVCSRDSSSAQSELKEAIDDALCSREEIDDSDDDCNQKKEQKKEPQIKQSFDAEAIGTLFQEGARLLKNLGETLSNDNGKSIQKNIATALDVKIERDTQTGKKRINFAVPENTAEIVSRIGFLFGNLLKKK